MASGQCIPRAPRHQFLASIDITDMQFEKHISGQTKNLSMFGCFVKSEESFPVSTKVKLTISRADLRLVAEGKVVYSKSGSGMGISFILIVPAHLPVLNDWLAQSRKSK